MQLFTFIYSKRTGTKAADMPDPTPRKEKTDRMTRLLKVQDEIAMALVKAQVGQTVTRAGGGLWPRTKAPSRAGSTTTSPSSSRPIRPCMGQLCRWCISPDARATVLLGELTE